MNDIEKLKQILQRKTKSENSRYLRISSGETAREVGCSKRELGIMLNTLCARKDIKALVSIGPEGDYELTVLENSSIWKEWHL